MIVEAVLLHTHVRGIGVIVNPDAGNILEKTVIIRVRRWTGQILRGLKVDVETAIFKCI